MSTILDLYKVRPYPGKEIGIEIEIEGRNLIREVPKFWNVVEDNSLRAEAPYGAFEYVLKIPVSRAKVSQRLNFLQEELRKGGSVLRPSDRCGVHIHVNCQELTCKQTMNFALLYLVFENLLVRWCGSEREGNLFCLRASDADTILHGLSICMERDNFHYVQKSDFRYASINLAALQKFGTLEFRSMGTPKNFNKINNWVRLLLKVFDSSKVYTEPYEIVEAMSAQGGQGYTRQVFQELSRELACDDMNRLCMEGVRRIQQIAYTPKKPSPENKKQIRRGAVQNPERVDYDPDRHEPEAAPMRARDIPRWGDANVLRPVQVDEPRRGDGVREAVQAGMAWNQVRNEN